MNDVKMIFMGDVNIGRPDADSAFNPVLHLLKDADIKFCNLETVIADAEYLSRYDRDPHPRTDESTLSAYLKVGINVMNQANNPNTYHGPEALVRSLEVLDRAGVIHAGAGRNMAEARKPAIVECNGLKVAFVCRTSVGIPEMAATKDTPGVAFYPVYTMYEAPPGKAYSNPGWPPVVHTVPDRKLHRDVLEADIHQARQLADVVIVSWHWGLSPFQIHPGARAGDVEVMEYQKEMGHIAIDCGADLVIGHHSHEPQPIEIYKHKAIFYSLGNFIHDLELFKEKTLIAILVHCVVRDGTIQYLSFLPGILEGNGPPLFKRPAQSPEVVNLLIKMSSPFGTRFEVKDDEIRILL